MRRQARFSTLILLVLCFLSLSSAHASNAFHVTDYDVHLTLNRDGSVSVREEFFVLHDSSSRQFRPLPYISAWTVSKDFILTDGKGSILTRSYDNRYEIVHDDPRGNSTANYVLTYTIHGAIRWITHEGKSVAALNWPLKHPRLELLEIDTFSFTMSFPKARHQHAGVIRIPGRESIVYLNSNQTTTSDLPGLSSQLTASSFRVEGRGLDPDSNFAFAVFVGEDDFPKPGFFTSVANYFRLWWPIHAAGFYFALVILVWMWKGRSPVVFLDGARLAPPKDIDPAMCSSLDKFTTYSSDRVAGYLQLANKGYLLFDRSGGDSLKSVSIVRTDKEADSDLEQYEQALLYRLNLRGGERFYVTQSERAFTLPKQRFGLQVDKEMVRRGLYPRNPAVTTNWSALFLLVAPLLLVVPILQEDSRGLETKILLVYLMILGVGCSIVPRMMLTRTSKGAIAQAELEAFYQALQYPDSAGWHKPIHREYQEYLPYAVALGKENEWATICADVSRTPPTWYRENGAVTETWDPVAFSGFLRAWAKRWARSSRNAHSYAKHGPGRCHPLL